MREGTRLSIALFTSFLASSAVLSDGIDLHRLWDDRSIECHQDAETHRGLTPNDVEFFTTLLIRLAREVYRPDALPDGPAIAPESASDL